MTYKIVFLRDSREVASLPWRGDKASAEKHARDQLETYMIEDHATSVQVIEVETARFVYWFSGGD